MSRRASHHLPGHLAALTVVAVLALVGCGGDSDDNGDAGRSEETSAPAGETTVPAADGGGATGELDTEVPDLCTLFTAEDFTAVTGEEAGEPEEVLDAGGTIRATCSIGSVTGFPLVMLGAYNESDRAATMELVEAEPVDDLGVEAYWDTSIGVIIPLEGKDWYLQVYATDGGTDLDRSVKAAEIVLERLEG